MGLWFQAPGSLILQADLVGSVRGPAPLPELADWPSLLSPCLDNVAALPVWDGSTNQTDAFSLPNRQPIPLTTTDARGTGQTVSTTEPNPLYPSHTPYFGTSDSSTDFAITLLKPHLTQGNAIVLPRIETHVYLDINLPSRYWNAIQLPRTKSVTSDNSSRRGEGIKPLLLHITVRGVTTRQECNHVCEQCEKRIGNKIGPPSLIDFHSSSNILTPKRGIVQVHFTFSCYSRHHQKEDEQYVYVAVAQ